MDRNRHDRVPLATVGALAVGPSGRVLLIRTHKWNDTWGVPGGKIHYGETMLQALEREFLEETGLELYDVHPAPTQESVESAAFYEPAHFLLINFVARAAGEGVALNEEAQAFAWVAPEEARGYDLNAPTRILVEYFLRHGFAGERLDP